MHQLTKLFHGDYVLNEDKNLLNRFLCCRTDAVKAIIISSTFTGNFTWVTENTVLFLLAMWMKKNRDLCTSGDIRDLSSLIRIPCLSDTYKNKVLPSLKWFRSDVDCIRPVVAPSVSPMKVVLVRRIVIKHESTRKVIIARFNGIQRPNNTIRLHCGRLTELYFYGYYWGKFYFEFRKNGDISICLSCSTKMIFTDDDKFNENFDAIPLTCNIHASIFEKNQTTATHNVCLKNQKVTSRIRLFSWTESSMNDLLESLTELKVMVTSVM